MERVGRRWFNIGVTKLPYTDRDLAHTILRDPAVEFYDIIGADTSDDDDQFPVGADCTYSLYLTEQQADQASEASNLRYIEPDQVLQPVLTPTVRTMTWMGASFPTLTTDWHGKDVPVAILDQGTTAVVRNLMGWQLMARRFFSGTPAGEVHPDPTYGLQIHGCLTSSCGVPTGGMLIDAVVTSAEGTAPLSSIAAAIKWACDAGAKVVNLSFGGLYGPTPVVQDALIYMNNYDCEFYGSAGNDGFNDLSYPAAYSRNYSYCNSVVAFDETTDTRGSFSNWAADATGAAPGVLVNGLMPDATERSWSGTSAASPHAARLCAYLQTGGKFTARAAGAALRANLRNMNRGAQQGGGGFHLQRALAGYGELQATNHAMLSLI